jgi:hypothetical protein
VGTVEEALDNDWLDDCKGRTNLIFTSPPSVSLRDGQVLTGA